jgi:hypothetical protein
LVKATVVDTFTLVPVEDRRERSSGQVAVAHGQLHGVHREHVVARDEVREEAAVGAACEAWGWGECRWKERYKRGGPG